MKREKSSVDKTPKPQGKFLSKVDNFFGITRSGSSYKIEMMGGLTTFFAMVYIMLVNPSTMTGSQTGKLFNAVYIATALGAIVGTLLYAFFAKLPFAQASGMGLNAFFFVSFMIGAQSFGGPEAGYSRGLTVIFLSGIIFMILSVSGVRKKIVESVPKSLKKAIPAGIGLFIAFIGLKDAGVIAHNGFVFVQLQDINLINPQSLYVNPFKTISVTTAAQVWYLKLAPILVSLIGIILIAILTKRGFKGAIITAIVSCTALFYLFNIGNQALFDGIGKTNMNLGQSFKDFGELAAGKAFFGFNTLFANEAGKVTFGSVMAIIMLVITFVLVDMFDTLGTLQATATEAGMLDEHGNPIRLSRALYADSIATTFGAVMGTSTVTTFVESSAGVSAGARTGFASLITALGFFIVMFFAPIAAIVPASATAPALIFVGILMLKNFKDVDMKDLTSAVPAFFTLIMMPLTFSISNGIAIGMILHTLMKVFTLKFRKKDIIPAIIAILFTIRFLTTSM